jgi:enoyl-CoA hydratase/carnithine racemase
VTVQGIRIERQGPLAVLRLDKARGNAIDEALVASLTEAATELAADPAVGGVLLASAHPKVFCPGLDLVTLVEYDRRAMERFMLRFAQMTWALYALAKPMVAAVGGHAVAGGCILALTADLRVLKRGGAQIGLNEVRVGVPLPWTVSVLLRTSVSPAALTRVALLGRNFADEDALAAGLADELAPAEGFEEHCLARLGELAEKDPRALGAIKTDLRRETLASMKSHERERMDVWLDGWFSPPTQARIRDTVASLTKRA